MVDVGPNRRRVRIGALLAAVAWSLGAGLASASSPDHPGPPYPPPELDRAVYDQAGVFRPATVAALEATIDAIEARTGAEVVVYTDVWPYKLETSQTEANAAALIDQWGIGRRGFDDGLVILFDLDPSLVHGQVQLYAGSGFKHAFLSDSERQAIFDHDMLPLLQAQDLDGAALVAIQRIDAAATPEHARQLETARQLNALLGIIGGGLVLFGLGGWALFHWLRFGRDPVYTDSESVLVPAPPTGMTAATATLVFDGRTSRRTLTTALLDIASRGRLAFREEHRTLGLGRRKLAIDLGQRAFGAALHDLSGVGVDAAPSAGDAAQVHADEQQRVDVARARLALVDRRPLAPAEAYLERHLDSLAEGDTIESDDVPKLATAVPEFEQQVEDHAVRKGWFAARPSSVVGRWRGIAVGELVLGGIALWAGLFTSVSGLTLVGAAAIVVGLGTMLLAGAMPARTMEGAMQRAWLFAYRRTLAKTMEQARSMDQVVAEAGLDWLDTPDQAIVWSVALGLSDRVEDVLQRTLEDGRQGASVGYLPIWYRSESGASAGAAAFGGGSIFSGSGIPDLGGMFSALGTIGNAPSSSGSGGGGGFSGGGSGGGGGAGGGF